MKKREIFYLVQEHILKKYDPTLKKTFLTHFQDMLELLAEDIPIPWPQSYFLLNQKLLIVLEKDLRFAFLILECLNLFGERSSSEGLKSRRIILKYLMDFWQEFCQHVADSKPKDKSVFPQLITFQNWIRRETYCLKPRPPVDEWVDAWNERLRFYSDNYSVISLGGGAFQIQNFEGILDTPPYLRQLSPWEMKSIFEELERRANSPKSKPKNSKSEPKNQKAQGGATGRSILIFNIKNFFDNVQSQIFWILSFILVNYLFIVTDPAQYRHESYRNIATFEPSVSSGTASGSLEPSTAKGRSAKKGRPKVASLKFPSSRREPETSQYGEP